MGTEEQGGPERLSESTVEALDHLLTYPDPEVRELTERLMAGVDSLHRAALVRVANLLDHHGQLQQAVRDPVVGTVFDLYDLVPLTPEAQVERALEEIRPYIQSHGGQLEILGVREGVVRVRLAGSCSGCSGSAITLKRGVEAALKEGLPGFVEMQVEEAEPEPARPTFIALEQIRSITSPVKPVFEDAAAIEEVRGMLAVRVGKEDVLLHNVGGEIYAFRKGGQRVECFPVALEAGRIKVATNVPATAPGPTAAG